MEGQWEGQAEGSPQAGKRTADIWGGSVDVRLNEVQGQGQVSRKDAVLLGLWTETRCVCVGGQVGLMPGPRACLHRGEHRVLVGLAAHGPHSGGCRKGRGGPLHILLRPCPSTLSPRGPTGKT